jgi:ABC-type lipoprotein export system ATPase subunit
MGDNLLSDSKLQSDNLIKLDYLMREFIDLIDQAKLVCKHGIDILIQDYILEKNNPNDTSAKTIKIAQSIVNSILKGSYSYQNGIEKIEFANGKSTVINFASSGQQEVIWILLTIFLLILNDSKVFLIIEEPEAHLFPVAQKQIIDLISLFANYSKNQILLTTHSPYILSSFNNLLYAHKLGNGEDKKEVADIVDPHLWISPDRLDAYILEDGNARTIVDREMGLIQSAEIDRASNIIVDTFNQLFDLED